MLSKAHALEAGCPPDLADFIDAYPVEPYVWAELIACVHLRGEMVWQIVAADLAVGKDWNRILQELSVLPHYTGRWLAMTEQEFADAIVAELQKKKGAGAIDLNKWLQIILALIAALGPFLNPPAPPKP